jgi:4-amino-4-deoxy-L-arabinose transferase-like glycosyltransferase
LWRQAIIAEVYTLNALFISLTVLVLLIWRDSRHDGHLLLAAFLMGLSLTDHITSGLLLPGGVLFVFLVERRKLREWRLVLKGAGLFLVGLLPYAFIPIRASMDYLPVLSGASRCCKSTHPIRSTGSSCS